MLAGLLRRGGVGRDIGRRAPLRRAGTTRPRSATATAASKAADDEGDGGRIEPAWRGAGVCHLAARSSRQKSRGQVWRLSEKLLDCSVSDACARGFAGARGLDRLLLGEDRIPVASAFKIAIVGSGPAGSAPPRAPPSSGLSHVLLEKTDHLSDTIYKYQKGKHVMATPSQLVLRSDLDFEAGKREKVLGTWDEHDRRPQGQRQAQRRDRRRSPARRAISRSRPRPARTIDGRDRDPRHRHPGQSEPGPLPGRRGRGRSSISSTIPANISTSISS